MRELILTDREVELILAAIADYYRDDENEAVEMLETYLKTNKGRLVQRWVREYEP